MFVYCHCCAVNKLDQLDALVPALKSLAERHVGYGVKIPHYAIVGENLLFTLKHCMGDALWDAPETVGALVVCN